MEDVDDDFKVIQDDPLTRWETVHRGGSPAVVLAYSRFNFVRDRFELWFGARRTDHKEIGKAGDSGEIENDDVFRLLVRSKLGAGRG